MTEKDLLDIADRAASLMTGKGASGFDVYARSSATSSVEVKAQELDAYEEAVTWGVGVRVMLPGGKVGFAYSSGRDDAAEIAASAAAANAASAEPDEHNGFPEPPDTSYPDASLYDTRVISIPERDKIERAMGLEKAAIDFDPRIRRVRKASASFTESCWAVVNSRGVRAATRGTHLSCGIMVVAEDESGSQMGYDFDYRRRDGEIDYAGVGAGAAARAVGLLGARKAPSGLFPVLLENTVSSDFLGVLSASVSGESVIKGKSMLAGRTGRKVLSELIDILDDGLFPGGGGTRPFDDEGVPSRTTPLVVKGVLQGFLHNSYTAKRSGNASTGNASRGGFRTQPGVGNTNLFIAKGAGSPDELVSGISKGLFVRDVLGMHTANPITGDFSVGVSGHWVESGKVAYPVKEAAISGNILEMLTNVEAVGSDLRFRGRIGAPSILLKPISVSGE
jgi:PmbA protein